MNAIFTRRNGLPVLADVPGVFTVQKYSWKALGGPEKATILVKAGREDLYELLEWVRYGVQIDNDAGKPVWWGYVSRVEVNDGHMQTFADVEQMANRIAVAYTLTSAGASTTGERKTTDWVEDADSIGEFGTRELLASHGNTTETHALVERNRLLSRHKYPTGEVKFVQMDEPLSAVIYCAGWWTSVEWRYALVASPGHLVETSTQVHDILTSFAQFFQAVHLQCASGIQTDPFRNGDADALYETEELLSMGTVNGRRMLSSVDQFRICEITEEPPSSQIDITVDRAGKMYRFGEIVDPTTCPAGMWARLSDGLPGNLDTSRLSGFGPFMIERAEYDHMQETLAFEPAGEDLFDLGVSEG